MPTPSASYTPSYGKIKYKQRRKEWLLDRWLWRFWFACTCRTHMPRTSHGCIIAAY
jgi:hypothetical protein